MKKRILITSFIFLFTSIHSMQLTNQLQQLKDDLDTLHAFLLSLKPDPQPIIKEIDGVIKQLNANLNNIKFLGPTVLNALLDKLAQVRDVIQNDPIRKQSYEKLYNDIQNELKQRQQAQATRTYLLPSLQELTVLGLCPLQLPYGWGEVTNFVDRKTFKINQSTLGCLKNIGTNTALYQLTVVDQFALAQEMKIDPAICSVISIFNVMNLMDFSRTNDRQYLTNLINKPFARIFLAQLNVLQWPDIDQLKDYIKTTGDEGYNVENIDAISTVVQFDPSSAFFEENPVLKKKIHEGLQQEYFSFGLIIGNEESAQTTGRGHYFGFCIIKAGQQKQYIVVDGAPAAYHLQDNTFELARIKYLIDLLETGKSNIKLVAG